MGLYDRYLLPRLIDLSMRQRPIMRQREKIVPLASGRVLEIGIGSGLNLGFYDADKVQGVWGVEPSAQLRERALSRAADIRVPVELVGLSCGEIEMEDDSFDTVVMTYTLCSIEDKAGALSQMRRVLKPGGRLLFVEHGRAPEAAVAHLQSRLNPVWSRLSGGCHLDVAVPDVLAEQGFAPARLDMMYLPGPRFANFNYWGVATAR